jgi:hypothetical protein
LARASLSLAAALAALVVVALAAAKVVRVYPKPSKKETDMAVTQTSALQSQYYRELLTFVDMYGATSKLYVYASQVADRTSLIQARLTIAQTNEANMTALIAATTPAAPTQ